MKPTLDRATSEHGKAAGMEAVADHVADRFRAVALETIHFVALGSAEFTSDDVWAALPADVVTHDYRALGPLMLGAQRLGWIEPTGRFRLTDQRSRHRAPVRVWRSLIPRPLRVEQPRLWEDR